MPARRKRIAEARGGGTLVPLNKKHRKIIETAYGEALPDKVWRQVKVLTMLSTVFSSAETNTAPVEQVISKLKKLQDAVFSVKADIWGAPAEKSSKYLALPNKKLTVNNMFSSLRHATEAVSDVTTFILQMLEEAKGQGHPKGYMWDQWIQHLTEIMKANHLPYEVRKDSDKRADERQSSFVLLIHSLQNELPVEFRRFTSSRNALAQGIWRARNSAKLAPGRAKRPKRFWTPGSPFRGVRIVDSADGVK
jgi:hypothetical protein